MIGESSKRTRKKSIQKKNKNSHGGRKERTFVFLHALSPSFGIIVSKSRIPTFSFGKKKWNQYQKSLKSGTVLIVRRNSDSRNSEAISRFYKPPSPIKHSPTTRNKGHPPAPNIQPYKRPLSDCKENVTKSHFIGPTAR